jgi:hypothetical protein
MGPYNYHLGVTYELPYPSPPAKLIQMLIMTLLPDNKYYVRTTMHLFGYLYYV